MINIMIHDGGLPIIFHVYLSISLVDGPNPYMRAFCLWLSQILGANAHDVCFLDSMCSQKREYLSQMRTRFVIDPLN